MFALWVGFDWTRAFVSLSPLLRCNFMHGRRGCGSSLTIGIRENNWTCVSHSTINARASTPRRVNRTSSRLQFSCPPFSAPEHCIRIDITLLLPVITFGSPPKFWTPTFCFKMRVKDAPRWAPACSPAVDTYCGFLSLPTELRCHIYDYLLAEPHAITISAGYTTVFGHRIRDKARKVDVPGLPLDLAPLVRSNHDAALLSVATPPEIALDRVDTWTGGKPQLQLPGALTLLRTCRIINDELKDYMRGRKARKALRSKNASTATDDTEGLSLYVSYPHGVLVLNHLYPSLLKQARRVYISGYYTDTAKETELPLNASLDSTADLSLTPQSSFTTPPVRSTYRERSHTTNAVPRLRSSRTRLRLDAPLQQQTSPPKSTNTFPAIDKDTSSAALTALADTLRVLFPSNPTPSPPFPLSSRATDCLHSGVGLVSLQARILYPGAESYSSVWSDESSPVSHLLRGICGGKIDMQVKRGSLGCGVSLGVTPQPDKRVMSTSWENWRVIEQAPVGLNGRRMTGRGREVRLSDLDVFLTEV
jgi:hypothetical protein